MKDTERAILAFSQGEKIKSGIIWLMQAIQAASQPETKDSRAWDDILRLLLNLITSEVQLARNVGGDGEWDEILSDLEKAMAMISSGVGQESEVNLTRALSKTTNIAQRSMSFLKERQLL